MSYAAGPAKGPELPSNPLVLTAADAECSVTRAGRPVPDGYPAMVDELRVLLDRVAAAAPPQDLVGEITKLTAELNERLLSYEVPERDQLSGELIRLPGRAQLLTPVYTVDELDDRSMVGRVQFGRHHVGSNRAVHGGAIPLVFDEVLGRLALVGDRPRSRTAFLHVDYRAITPVDEELRLEAWFEREEGRKRFVRGVIKHDDQVCAEANGLFVALRPGQP